MLHAQQLSFEHPISQQEIHIQAGLDERWTKLFEQFNWQLMDFN